MTIHFVTVSKTKLRSFVKLRNNFNEIAMRNSYPASASHDLT